MPTCKFWWVDIFNLLAILQGSLETSIVTVYLTLCKEYKMKWKKNEYKWDAGKWLGESF